MLFLFLFIFVTACSAVLQLHALRVPDDRSWHRLGHVGTLHKVLFCLSWARIPRGSFQAAWEWVDRMYGVKIPIYAPLLEIIVILSYGILFVLFVTDLMATMPAWLIISAIRNLKVRSWEESFEPQFNSPYYRRNLPLVLHSPHAFWTQYRELLPTWCIFDGSSSPGPSGKPYVTQGLSLVSWVISLVNFPEVRCRLGLLAIV